MLRNWLARSVVCRPAFDLVPKEANARCHDQPIEGERCTCTQLQPATLRIDAGHAIADHSRAATPKSATRHRDRSQIAHPSDHLIAHGAGRIVFDGIDQAHIDAGIEPP
jgi:hypothetical protein